MFQTIITFLTFSIAMVSPLGVSWDNQHEKVPEISGYKYYYGDVLWGKIIYFGTEDILGMESEIHLFFDRKKITKAILILGPAGINEWNCIQKYKRVQKLISEKYGKFNYISEKKDPIINDLLTTYTCYPVRLGIHEINTYWDADNYKIQLSLIGDDDGYYIETTYVHKNREKNRSKKQKKKTLKKF